MLPALKGLTAPSGKCEITTGEITDNIAHQGSLTGQLAHTHQQLSCDIAWGTSAGALPLLRALPQQLFQERLPALEGCCLEDLAPVLRAQAPQTA